MPLLSSYHRTRLLLYTATGICFVAFWWVGRMMGIPVNPGFEDSLLQQPHALVAVLVVAVMLGVCTALGTALAGSIRFNAGLVVACLGLSALSMRSGAIRYTIFWGLGHGLSAQRIFGRLFFEMVILTVLVGGCWWALRSLHAMEFLRDREHSPKKEPTDAEKPRHNEQAKGGAWDDAVTEVAAVGLQALVTLVLVLFLAATEDKKQVLAAVFIGALVGPMISHLFFASGPRGWYWVAPLVVGMIGYAFAWANPAGAEIGVLKGALGALARPLPLDYASAGTAGAIIGSWMSRRWARDREEAA